MSQALFDIPLKRIDGTPATLGDFRGKVLLVVNVASKCGLTPQYAALEKLYEARHGDGLEILGFPANDFGAQEPGTESEIASFCSLTYGVTFPMFEKISVVGATRHPLYDALVAARPETTDEEGRRPSGRSASPSDVSWNFEKFVVGRDGRVIARFSPRVTPDDPRLTKALDAALEAKA
ncbi:glutathione peroxidase [Xanthobacter versatilis]|uniref:glutathione peroxidase n=1 Tax=Xanthobacter autotrophicus (strain ATCC BAA-1158 / Py2) TaxID=78245 RepID=UPI00372739AC